MVGWLDGWMVGRWDGWTMVGCSVDRRMVGWLDDGLILRR